MKQETKQKIRVMLIRANRYIFGRLLNFSFWELKAFERLVRGKDRTIYDYVPVSKYHWKTRGL